MFATFRPRLKLAVTLNENHWKFATLINGLYQQLARPIQEKGF